MTESRNQVLTECTAEAYWEAELQTVEGPTGAEEQLEDIPISDAVVVEDGYWGRVLKDAETGEFILDKVTIDVLEDVSSTGKVFPWREKLMANEKLAIAYEKVNELKSRRLLECSRKLVFETLPDDRRRLVSAWFCRVRLCPMCIWRHSLKVAAHMTQILEAIRTSDKPCAYILLTLTQRNCGADELSGDITNMLKAFTRLTKTEAVKRATCGYYRGMEVTHDVDEHITPERYEKSKKYFKAKGIKPGDINPGFDSFHPHIHTIFAVNPSYFTDKTYLSQAAWTELWRQALRVDYSPSVRVQKVKGDTSGAVAEVSKYTVKDAEYIIPDDWQLTIDTLRVLDRALDKRRFVGYGGIFADWHRRLHLEDTEEGDLVDVGGEENTELGTGQLISFVWHSGYRQFIAKVDFEV